MIILNNTDERCSTCLFFDDRTKTNKKCRNVSSWRHGERCATFDKCDSYVYHGIDVNISGRYQTCIEFGDLIVLVSGKEFEKVFRMIQKIKQIIHLEKNVDLVYLKCNELERFDSFIKEEIPDVYMKLKKEFRRREYD